MSEIATLLLPATIGQYDVVSKRASSQHGTLIPSQLSCSPVGFDSVSHQFLDAPPLSAILGPKPATMCFDDRARGCKPDPHTLFLCNGFTVWMTTLISFNSLKKNKLDAVFGGESGIRLSRNLLSLAISSTSPGTYTIAIT
jgi:hypothetical protein